MTDRMLPLSEVRQLLEELMQGREHLAQAPFVTRDESGWLPPAELPADRGLRLENFMAGLDGLPDPVPEADAVEAIMTVFRARGCRFLGRELADLWDERFPPETAEAVPASGMRCQVCGVSLPAGSRSTRRTCGTNCRQKLYQVRKRANGKARLTVVPLAVRPVTGLL